MADFHCIESEKINTPKKIYISTDIGCRLCGNINDRMLNLFHKPSQKKNLVKHVTDTLGITIYENDEMSQLMCRCCERKLVQVCKIFRLALNQIFLSKDVIHRQKNQTRNECPQIQKILYICSLLLAIRTVNCLSKRHQRMSPTCRVNPQHRTVMLLIFKM